MNYSHNALYNGSMYKEGATSIEPRHLRLGCKNKKDNLVCFYKLIGF
jgi:hypothetical protein